MSLKWCPRSESRESLSTARQSFEDMLSITCALAGMRGCILLRRIISHLISFWCAVNRDVTCLIYCNHILTSTHPHLCCSVLCVCGWYHHLSVCGIYNIIIHCQRIHIYYIYSRVQLSSTIVLGLWGMESKRETLVKVPEKDLMGLYCRSGWYCHLQISLY